MANVNKTTRRVNPENPKRENADDDKAARKAAIKEAEAIEIAEIVEELNDDYFLSHQGGQVGVYQQVHDEKLDRSSLVRFSVPAFHALYANKTVTITGANGFPKSHTHSEVWYRSPDRREFTLGIVFDPSEDHSPSQYNLWKGLAVKPKKGDWGLLRGHIREVVCNGDEDHFDYFMDWCARLVQRPDLVGEVALVLRGREGTGKSIVANALVKIHGQHAMKVSQPSHLVGHFNAHLEDCVLLVVEEGFHAGDTRQASVLKSLVTDHRLMIERKGMDAYLATNRLHIMILSNEERVVPAGADARRYFVLTIGDKRMSDFRYFAAMQDQLDNGGHEAMAYELMNRSLRGFNVREIPSSEALNGQKIQSFDSWQKWFHDVLVREYAQPMPPDGLKEGDLGWVSSELLYDSYMQFAREHRQPPSSIISRQTVIARVVEVAEYGHRVRRPFGGKRTWGYTLGSLEVVRANFERKSGTKIVWSDEKARAENDNSAAKRAKLRP